MAAEARRTKHQKGTGFVPTTLPHMGVRLRRLRRLRGLKQSVVAEITGVTQATVSRWEHGEIEPSPDVVERLLAFLGGTTCSRLDGALRRLVEASALAVHLVADHDHRLLCASAPREREWGLSAADLVDVPLWRFATRPIEAAEARLDAGGWWDEMMPAPVELDPGHGNRGLRFRAGLMVWERLYLADGTPVRLCTTLGAGPGAYFIR